MRITTIFSISCYAATISMGNQSFDCCSPTTTCCNRYGISRLSIWSYCRSPSTPTTGSNIMSVGFSTRSYIKLEPVPCIFTGNGQGKPYGAPFPALSYFLGYQTLPSGTSAVTPFKDELHSYRPVFQCWQITVHGGPGTWMSTSLVGQRSPFAIGQVSYRGMGSIYGLSEQAPRT